MGEMTTLPAGFEEFLELLRRRHAAIMDGRPDKNPGAFKTKVNRAGETVFVAPDLVTGTLERGFAFVQALAEQFQRAAFMMFWVSISQERRVGTECVCTIRPRCWA